MVGLEFRGLGFWVLRVGGGGGLKGVFCSGAEGVWGANGSGLKGFGVHRV